MTNEQQKAKELAELLIAFAEGKQFLLNSVTGWIDLKFETVEEIILYFHTPENIIRIKPETKRIALTQQDLIDRELSGKTMRMKIGNEIRLITKWDEHYLWIDGYKYYYDSIVMGYPFLDNSPCYKEVECE